MYQSDPTAITPRATLLAAALLLLSVRLAAAAQPVLPGVAYLAGAAFLAALPQPRPHSLPGTLLLPAAAPCSPGPRRDTPIRSGPAPLHRAGDGLVPTPWAARGSTGRAWGSTGRAVSAMRPMTNLKAAVTLPRPSVGRCQDARTRGLAPGWGAGSVRKSGSVRGWQGAVRRRLLRLQMGIADTFTGTGEAAAEVLAGMLQEGSTNWTATALQRMAMEAVSVVLPPPPPPLCTRMRQRHHRRDDGETARFSSESVPLPARSIPYLDLFFSNSKAWFDALTVWPPGCLCNDCGRLRHGGAAGGAAVAGG